MINKGCLSEQDLILLHYGERPAAENAAQHLARCPDCTGRLSVLQNDLAKLPQLNCEVGPVAATRMAARVKERRDSRRRKSWRPALGAAAVAVAVLVITLIQTPQPEPPQITRAAPASAFATGFDDEMPDIDFLEDLDLLKEFELLAQIEGV